jgi:hypothetical protein
MPKPNYIICSESGSEDKETGLISLFNLVDTFQITKGPPLPTASPIAQLRVTSSWMRESGDEGKDFEFEALVKPPHGDEIKLAKGSFEFKTKFARVSVRLLGLFPVTGEGIFWVETRIRRSGSKGWTSQKTPLIFELIPSSPNPDGTSQPSATVELTASVAPETQGNQAAV